MKNQNSEKKLKKHVIIFIIITLMSGWIGVLIDKILIDQPQGNSLGMGMWLVLPFFTGLILRLFSKDWSDIGVKLNLKKWKFYLLSILIYPLVTILVIGIGVLFHCVDISAFHLSDFIPLAFMSLLGSLIKNIFEEFAWRGYLTPKLIKLKYNDWVIYGISGLVWALWHCAYYLVFLPDEYFTTTSRGAMIVSGIILMSAWNIMFVEIYRITKSVWPCVLMHAIEDAVPNVLVMTGGYIIFTNGSNFWLNPISGVLSTVLFVIIGLGLRQVRMKMK